MGPTVKIVTIVGARPQFVKAAVVSRALKEAGGVREVLIHTGQHYDAAMSDVFFTELGLPKPDFNLGVGSGQHGAQTGRMLEATETILLREKPDWVLIYGDTNSTLAGALAASKLGVPLAHVEAGLRSYKRAMPEEINRVIADHVSDLLLAPTAHAVDNLRREGIDEAKVRLVGDVMFDATLHYGSNIRPDSLLADFGLTGKPFALVTLHRAENTDDPNRLAQITQALIKAGRNLPILFPLHPRTQAALEQADLLRDLKDAVICAPPQGYLDMLALERSAAVVITDSGGVQKEAFFFGVPCLILRDRTEWVELVETGWAQLCEPSHLESALLKPPRPTNMDRGNLFGGGQAGRHIAQLLLNTPRPR